VRPRAPRGRYPAALALASLASEACAADDRDIRRLLPVLVAALALSAAPGHAATFAPPPGKVYTGLSGSTSTEPFTQQVDSDVAVFGVFTKWYGQNEYAFRAAREAGARLMLHVSTQDGYGTRELITPLGIARGEGDRYLLSLNRRIAEAGEPVYVRLLAEMNQANNGYSAFDRNGRSRGPAHSTKAFRAAWRRSALILRGGPLATIDAKLRALRLPPVQGEGEDLPRPQVALLWVPQTEGSPAIAANAARAYWPGGRYVDWVGTDFYSRFPNFDKLERFYDEFRGKPFVFGEWALWGRDDPAFVRRLFRWITSHPRVRMQLYNQGKLTDGPFRLNRYPRSRAALRRALAHRRNLTRP
jgi:hypothetical protein